MANDNPTELDMLRSAASEYLAFQSETNRMHPPVLRAYDALRALVDPAEQRRQARARFYELQDSDVGRPTINAFGHVWWVSDFIGRIMPMDVGKRVYKSGDVLQVENQAQRSARVLAAAARATGIPAGDA